jgi:pimeloyl-ACP methyl ester carboxylesterase
MSASTQQVIADWSGRGRRLDAARAGTSVWEEGEGEPVVCLHGVPSSSFLYRKVLPALAERGLRGVAFDLPGLGLADRPEDFDYTWSGLGAWTAGAVDALDLDRFHLVVHDIGGTDRLRPRRPRAGPHRVAHRAQHDGPRRVVQASRGRWSRSPAAASARLAVRTLHPIGFERLMRLQGVATAVPSEELRAYVPLLKRGDGGAAFLRIMRGFERTEAFERRILDALGSRAFPGPGPLGRAGPRAAHRPLRRARPQGARARRGRPACPGKHFVQEDAPGAIAERVAGLVARD